MTPAEVVVASGGDASSPIYAVFLALIGGGLVTALVTLFKARPERDLTVASSAEKQVVMSISMLEHEKDRADRAEKRAAELEVENERLEADLMAMRAEVADLTRRLDDALARTRHTRESHPAPRPRRQEGGPST